MQCMKVMSEVLLPPTCFKKSTINVAQNFDTLTETF